MDLWPDYWVNKLNWYFRLNQPAFKTGSRIKQYDPTLLSPLCRYKVSRQALMA